VRRGNIAVDASGGVFFATYALESEGAAGYVHIDGV
jgi:hypothetical protein